MTWRVDDGDCREVMARMEAESVTAIVSDPPYGLAFMGHGWDHSVPGVEYWTAALRVLKPGGMLLAFGGTRTWHRLAVAIEDAGFVIRDSLTRFYCYGSGFPKSHQFGCKCATDALPYSHENEMADGEMRDVRGEVREEGLLGKEGHDALLQLQVQRGPAREGMGEAWSQGRGGCDAGGAKARGREEDGGAQPCMEGRRDLLQEARQLQANQICEVSAGPDCNGEEGRVCDGTPSDNGPPVGPSASESGSGPPCESRSAGQQAGKSGVISGQQDAQIGRGEAHPVCEKCGGIVGFGGYGTALKPAFEPIILAMKPNAGTFAQNARAHGVAGLNIDGCRIGVEGTRPHIIAQGVKGGSKDEIFQTGSGYAMGEFTLGRWPANVILDEEAGALLDQKSGELTSGDREPSFNASGNGWKNSCTQTTGTFGGDSGGASRFFYCAKASRSEREAGLQEAGLQEAGQVGSYEFRQDGSLDGNVTGPRRNTHATVKPLDLMRWLCRLVKMPKGSTILDPFAGSGTTGCAAVLEGCDFIGIELNPEYAKIARARIAHWEKNGAPPDQPKRNPAEMPGTPLFGDL